MRKIKYEDLVYSKLKNSTFKNSNIKLKPGFDIVCIWPSHPVVGIEHSLNFENNIFNKFGIHCQYLEEFENTESSDVLFAIKKEDISNFAVPRFKNGIIWLSEVIDTKPFKYPSRIKYYPHQ